jgi:hypothetical protein
MKLDHAFIDLQNQLHAVDCQSLEGANRWKYSKQLLMMTKVRFCKQERRPSAHNEPKNRSPDITKEGLSPVSHRRSSEEQPQHYRVQESYANQD